MQNTVVSVIAIKAQWVSSCMAVLGLSLGMLGTEVSKWSLSHLTYFTQGK